MAYTLDTSGFVQGRCGTSAGRVFWSGLTPFAQGTLQAMFAEWHKAEIASAIAARCTTVLAHFRHLSPEALAMILGDCKTYQANRITGQFTGEGFWRERQEGHRIDFPPLTPHLGDDGMIYLRAAEPA